MLTGPGRLGWCVIRDGFDSTLCQALSQYITDLESTTRLQSITQERDLDEFLNTAQLAGTQFTAGTSYRMTDVAFSPNTDSRAS